MVSFFGHQLCIALVRVPPKTGPDFAPFFFLKTETMVGHFQRRDLGPNMYKESFVCIRFAKTGCGQQLWCCVLAAKLCDPNLLCHLGGNRTAPSFVPV